MATAVAAAEVKALDRPKPTQGRGAVLIPNKNLELKLPLQKGADSGPRQRCEWQRRSQRQRSGHRPFQDRPKPGAGPAKAGTRRAKAGPRRAQARHKTGQDRPKRGTRQAQDGHMTGTRQPKTGTRQAQDRHEPGQDSPKTARERSKTGTRQATKRAISQYTCT